MKTKPNSISLHIWIAENGDAKAREALCKEVQMTSATLCRILKGHMPKFEIRYRIYKTTGIKLDQKDDFPVPRENAS